MSKIITDEELVQIIKDAVSTGNTNDRKDYQYFVRDLAKVVA